MSQIEGQTSGDGLAVEQVRKVYETPAEPLVVLDGVSFEVSPGESVSVVGPSGSGKSTLLNLLGSLDRPTSGSIRLGDVAVHELAEPEVSFFRSRRVGFIFQAHHLLPQCTALENVALPTLPAGRAKAGLERARGLLEKVGLAERMNALPSRLSGGERQRVATARALINDPDLLLCDEPTGNLDKETGARLGELFAELAEDRNAILVVVSHDPDFALRFAPVLELRRGRLQPRRPE